MGFVTIVLVLLLPNSVRCWCRPNERADLIFILEESYSTAPTEWDYQKHVVSKFVNQMYINPNNGIRVGVVTYNTEPTSRFHLNTHTTKEAIQSAIMAISTDRNSNLFENDTDYSDRALSYAYTTMFQVNNGDRSDAPNYYIYTSDSLFDDDNPYTEVNTIRGAGDNYVWAIGVRDAASQSKLSQSVGVDGRYFTGSSFNAINTDDFAVSLWEAFSGCPITDPAIGKYYCFMVPLLYFEDPSAASAVTEVCEQDQGMMFLMQDSLFEINCCGLITAWEFYPCTVGIVQFMVWTFKSGTTYELKAIQEVEVIDTQVSFEETNYLTSAADHWPVGTSFTSYAIQGQDYKENVTFSWVQQNAYIDLNESYSFIQVARQLEPSESTIGMAGYLAKLKVQDTCQNSATATFSVETFNGPPVITNFPKEMSLPETQAGSELIYSVNVYDPTVPPDAVCCTLESVRPQTSNFELNLMNGTEFRIFTYEKPIFAFRDVNSYMLTVCCEDGFGTVKGILKIDITEVKEKELYTPPSWFYTSLIASLLPISIMFILSCWLLCFTMFCMDM
ncbi:uncharacterized protein LOC125648025 isoform X2 [Ostrea edulis]|uniref:uncharacterized protein LOC125648025 isoform X2 n=1 Tax=Ostrea edulis TaxID=37623 RepID=UPI0024AEC2AA|nr:uncharacterized protein LOC125648025 isoform X2 [Ostrea edulis]